jgi:thiol-disulfide isomerase/thioredoxin
MTYLRLFKVFVILGFPFLGWLYAYQFSDAFNPSKRDFVTPFKPFKVEKASFCPGSLGVLNSDSGKLICDEQSQVVLFDGAVPKVRLLSFWASWCAPCVEEFPAMIELQSQFKNLPFDIVFVSVNETWAEVEEFYRKNQIDVMPENSLWDPRKEMAQAWGSEKFPEAYVVRPDGWVVEKVIGAQQWTRPAVVKYFQELVAKFVPSDAEKQAKSFLLNFDLLGLTSVALAEGTKGVEPLAVDPLIHEQDKKNLEVLKKNIDTASGNLSKAEGAFKEEERNLNEQKIVRDRRNKDLQSASEEMEKVNTKLKEIDLVFKKTVDSLSSEKAEKIRVEAQIKTIQAKIKDLEKQLEAAKDELTQTGKTLNTRVTNIETLEKAEESTREESDSVKLKQQKAREVVQEKRTLLLEVEKDISLRDRKLKDIGKTVEKAKLELQNQKKKLADFEQVLRK